MKILVTQVLKNYEGKSIYEERVKRDDEGKTVRNEDGEPITEDVKLTLRSVIITALLGSEPNKPRTAEDKNKADQINRKIWEKKEVDLTVKQRGYILEKVGIFFNPLVLGRVEDALERKDEKVEEGKAEEK